MDDVVGWDFAFGDPDPDAYAFDGTDRNRIQPYEHGMPALGIIGARGDNGIGIAGINWGVSLMPLRIGVQGTPRGHRDLERPGRAAKAIHYAKGARVINWSEFRRAGTFNAGPVVAGVAALALATRPDLRAADLRALLMQTATPHPGLQCLVASGGTVNAARLLDAIRRR